MEQVYLNLWMIKRKAISENNNEEWNEFYNVNVIKIMQDSNYTFSIIVL